MALKVTPLSEYMISDLPLRAMNLLRLGMNCRTSKDFSKSRWTGLVLGNLPGGGAGYGFARNLLQPLQVPLIFFTRYVVLSSYLRDCEAHASMERSEVSLEE